MFDLSIYETGEENLIYIDIWFNMGSLTNGAIYGFLKGFRFDVELEGFRKFVYELEEQFISIIKESGV